MQVAGLVRKRRLHGNHTQHLQQVVLHDVTQNASLVKVAGTPANSDVFRKRDLYVVNIPVVPDRLEKSVGKAHEQDVLHRLFAEIVVYAQNLFLTEGIKQLCIEFLSCVKVVPEWFLNQNPLGTVFVSVLFGKWPDQADEILHAVRRHGKIEKARRSCLRLHSHQSFLKIFRFIGQ